MAARHDLADDGSSHNNSLVEQLCRSRLFELFQELPGQEVEDCYMRCGGVLRSTYQMLLERMASTPVNTPIFPPSTAHRSMSSGDGGDDADDGTSSTGTAETPTRVTEMLAELEAERRRAEAATRTIEAEAELAAKELKRHESSIVASESARESAERAAEADRLQCEEVLRQLSSIRERVEQLDADFQQRVQDATGAEIERELAASAAAAAEDAANAAAAASLMDRVAKLEASIASTGEALESVAARRKAATAEEMRAREEEAELRKTIEDLKIQQEQDERDTAEQEDAVAREQKKREQLEDEISELHRKRGRVDGELDQLGISFGKNVPSHDHKVGKSAAEVGGTSTDPNGIEPLVGEDEASYIKRQRRLQQEAKERMAAKFGGSGVGQEHRQRMKSISSSGSSAAAELAAISASTAENVPAPSSTMASTSPASSTRTSSGRNSPTLPPSSGLLHVTVVACNNILAADPSGRSDAFIKLRLGSEERCTTVCQKTLNPVFNETLDLPIDVATGTKEKILGAQLSSDTFRLQVEVWDKDRYSRDDFLGECSVHLLDVFAGVWGSEERHVHCAFEDPQRRVSARERKQAKRRGGSYGTVDLRCSFETKTPMPSLAEWLAERDLTVYRQLIAEAMKKAEVPDGDTVPMLDGMDSRELQEFIDACARSVENEQHEVVAAPLDAPGSPIASTRTSKTFVPLAGQADQPGLMDSSSIVSISSVPATTAAKQSSSKSSYLDVVSSGGFVDDDTSDFEDDDFGDLLDDGR